MSEDKDENVKKKRVKFVGNEKGKELLEKAFEEEDIKVDHDFGDEVNLPWAAPAQPDTPRKQRKARFVKGDHYYLALLWKRVKGKFRLKTRAVPTKITYVITYSISDQKGEPTAFLESELILELTAPIHNFDPVVLLAHQIKKHLGIPNKEKIIGTASYFDKQDKETKTVEFK